MQKSTPKTKTKISSKYNVLMMRDNTPVKRYRLSPMWLKLAFWMLVLLVASAGCGGYFGYTFWTQNKDLNTDLMSTQRELREARIELERLQNIEKILKSNDPEELQALFGTPVGHEVETKPAPQAPPPPPINLTKLFKRVDVQQVKVDNVIAKYSGNNLRVTFNLNNLQTDDTISGRADMILVSNTGKDIPVKLNRNDLVYQIQRFKQITTSFGIPSGMPKANIFGLKLFIRKPTGQVIFSETYPLANIQS